MFYEYIIILIDLWLDHELQDLITFDLRFKYQFNAFTYTQCNYHHASK